MISHGARAWPFAAVITGTIAVGPGLATYFGGDDDPQDDGQTASGYPTKGHPDLLACALPMTDAGEPATQGSPIPHLDWWTLVQVNNLDNGLTITLPVIDLGPGKSANDNAVSQDKIEECHIIDLTAAAFRALGGNLKDGTMRVSYVILDQKMTPGMIPGPGTAR